jgi:hypothetical protein
MATDFDAPIDFDAAVDFDGGGGSTPGGPSELTPAQFRAAAAEAINAAVTTVLFRVDIYERDATTIWMRDAPLIGGNINISNSRDERRTLDLKLDNYDGRLKHYPGGFWYDKVIKPYRGVRTPVGDYLLQQGEFILDSISRDDFPNHVTLAGRDYTAHLLSSQFERPVSFAQGQSLDQIVRAIALNAGIRKLNIPPTNVLAYKVFFFDAGTTRWEAIKQITEPHGYQVFFDRYGYLTMAPFPDPATGAEEWTFRGYASASGDPNLASYSKAVSTARLRNHLIVKGDSSTNGNVFIELKVPESSPIAISKIGDRIEVYQSGFFKDNAEALAFGNKYLPTLAMEDYEIQTESPVIPWLDANVIVRFEDPDPDPIDPARFLLTDIDIPMELGVMRATSKRITLIKDYRDNTNVGTRIAVPNLSGKTLTEANAALLASGLRSTVSYVVSTAANVGKVLGQNPGPGELVMRDSSVSLTVGKTGTAAQVKLGEYAGASYWPSDANISQNKALGAKWCRFGPEWQWYDTDGNFDDTEIRDGLARLHAAGQRAIIVAFGLPDYVHPGASSLPHPNHVLPATDAECLLYVGWLVKVAKLMDPAKDILEIWNEPNIQDFNNISGTDINDILNAAKYWGRSVAWAAQAIAGEVPGLRVIAGSVASRSNYYDTGGEYEWSMPRFMRHAVEQNPELITLANSGALWGFGSHPYCRDASTNNGDPRAEVGWNGHVQNQETWSYLKSVGVVNPRMIATEWGEASYNLGDGAWSEAWQQSHFLLEKDVMGFRRALGHYHYPFMTFNNQDWKSYAENGFMDAYMGMYKLDGSAKPKKNDYVAWLATNVDQVDYL